MTTVSYFTRIVWLGSRETDVLFVSKKNGGCLSLPTMVFGFTRNVQQRPQTRTQRFSVGCASQLTRMVFTVTSSDGQTIDNKCGNVKFTMPCRLSDLKDDNKKNVNYVAKRIIGLSFDDGPKESPFGLECLSGMVQTIYLQSKSKEWDCVAYKGGHFERDLLESLGIPAINREDFGCPRYKELIGTGYDQTKTCGQHTGGRDIHCATDECYAFMRPSLDNPY